MKDLYSFHVDAKDCDGFYEKVKESYFSIYKKAGLAQSTYVTLASGGTFSKFSHEFQTVTDAGEDTVYICDKCGLAINREIKSEYPKCPECGNTSFDEKKSIEVGNIFKLGTKYSGAFDFTAAGPEGQALPVLMNCYGIGLTRMMGTAAEIHRDDHGIVWPDAIAPFRVHLVALAAKDPETNARIAMSGDKIYSDLQKNKIEVLYDDRQGMSAGEKFNDADLLGMPVRIVISAKTLANDSVEIKRRDSKDASLIKMGDVAGYNF
jgi:prolyl-tRNA synthetase